ncbi:ABC transporter permease [Pediococcus siamensis]|uniref:ABC transporter permease n=1 Tax=Pediococcus siamensis TaxID=381829 RepID=UPI0039A34EE6
MFLAYKEMRYAKLRFILIIGIMVLVAYVVFMLSGLASGLANGHKKAIADWHSQTVVLSADSNKVASASILKQADLARVHAGGAKKAAVGIFSSAIQKQGSHKRTNMTVFGAKATAFVVPKVISGRRYRNAHEIIVSKNLSEENHYRLGDEVRLGSLHHKFKIVGITKATTYAVAPVAYANLNAFTKLKYGGQPFQSDREKPINLIAVKTKTPKKVRITTTAADTKVTKMSSATLIQNLPGFSAEKITLNTMIDFLFVVVAAIVGIFLYVMTLQKTALFGVLKAQGIKTAYLVVSVVSQALMVGVIGVALAFCLSYLTSLILPAAMPFSLDGVQWLIDGGILILVSILGGLFSVRTVTKVDPIKAIGGE